MDDDYLDNIFSTVYTTNQRLTHSSQSHSSHQHHHQKNIKKNSLRNKKKKKQIYYGDYSDIKQVSPHIYTSTNELPVHKISKNLIDNHFNSNKKIKKKKKKEKIDKFNTVPPLGKLSATERTYQSIKGNTTERLGYKDFSENIRQSNEKGNEPRPNSFVSKLRASKLLTDVDLESRNDNSEEYEFTTGKKSTGSTSQSTKESVMMTTISASSNAINIPEWTNLRDTYIRQLQCLEAHETAVRERGMNCDISIPNFIGLLLAIRKISFKIVDSYRQIILHKEGHHATFAQLHAYIIKMATDVNCINKQPFVDWMGISPLYNTFFSERKIDGTTALFAPLDRPPTGVKFQGEDESDPLNPPKKTIFMRRELQLSHKEQCIVDEMGSIIWNAYKNHQDMLRHKATAHTLENLYGLKDELLGGDKEAPQGGEEDIVSAAAALDVETALVNVRPPHLPRNTGIKLKEFWDIWRRVYAVHMGLRRIKEGREFCILRKIMDGWQVYVWQSIQFRLMQERRWTQLLTMTFGAWCQYLFWCRRFNAVLSMAIRENKRRVLRRMYLFSKQEYENRKFKRKQALMPLIITFRALKHNAVVNRFHVAKRLQRASKYLLSDLNLREFCFQRWRMYVNAGMAIETMDVALLLWHLRDAFYDWKAITWPKKYNSHGRKVLFKSLTSWTDAGGSFFGDDFNSLEEESEQGDLFGGVSIGTMDNTVTSRNSKKGWLAFALGS